MSTNGNIDVDDDRHRAQRVLAGAATADAVIVPLDRAADALRDVSLAFEGISLRLNKIGTDTARAISDTVQMKRYLKMFGEREEKLRAELAALKAQVARQQHVGKKDKKAGKKHKKKR
jgi:hypothetical protein